MTSEQVPFDKATLLDLERDYCARWWSAVEGLAPDTERGDGWTLLDVLAHLAAWQRFTVGRLGQYQRGDTIEPVEADAYNARVKAEAASRSWDEMRAEAEAAREAFRAADEATPQTIIEADEGRAAFTIAYNGHLHYEEHLEDFPRD